MFLLPNESSRTVKHSEPSASGDKHELRTLKKNFSKKGRDIARRKLVGHTNGIITISGKLTGMNLSSSLRATTGR